MARLENAARDRFVRDHPEWEVGDADIRRTFTFDDFVGSMGFVTKVALAAERANHHPDVDIRWNRVTLTLSTHSEGGLTSKDTELAETIDRLV
jgi:4a-hydroxytetrahydrobiopterin dehydratase